MIAPMSVSLVEKLTAAPVEIATARRPADQGGAPERPGFYAWWLTDDFALPAVPTSPHPTHPELGLLYVGIAPNNAESGATIRSRILENHLGNALGSSTLRRGLAALLWDPCWHPHITRGGKPALPSDESAALTLWMRQNLLVSWCVVTEPWNYEPTLIGEMAPPLNSEHNHSHPFDLELKTARAYMLAVARATEPT
jgi:hypothetical protein